MQRPRTICFLVALVAVLVVTTWQALTVHYNFKGNWTALFYTGALHPIPPELASSTYVFQNSTGYDGQFYRYIAHHPSPTGKYVQYIDDPRLRFQRILLPAVAHLIGHPDIGMVILVNLSIGLGVYWTARYLQRRGRHPAYGWIFLVVPATLASFDRILLDASLLALFAGFLLYLEENRWKPLVLICAAAPLVRETGILLIVGAVAHQAWNRNLIKAAVFATAALPAMAWWSYVAYVTPATTALPVFSWPVIPIVGRLLSFRTGPDALSQAVLRVTDMAALLGLLAAFYLGTRELRQLPTTGARVAVAGFILLGMFLTGESHLVDPFGFSRPISPLLLILTVAAITGRSKWNLFPPAAMTAAVSIYWALPTIGIVRGILGSS